ncbi:hypothetical protein ACCS79_03630 [Rhizobium johnstonii]|uniref:hypothetical protein n=1 Tax=Rhizobium johnstonii TaxID=3019933 RepID=UPI003F96041C
MLFSLWPLEKVEPAIVSLETSLTKGISQITNPTQGGISYRSADEARALLKALYRRYHELTGTKPSSSPGPRIFAMRRLEEY